MDDNYPYYEVGFIGLRAESSGYYGVNSAIPEFEWRKIDVSGGAIYEGTIYFWNDAASAYEDANTSEARVRLSINERLGRQSYLSATISAANTTPREVFSAIVLNARDKSKMFQVSLVPGSVFASASEEYPLDEADFLSSRGALIGCSSSDGVLTGKSDCKGSVRFKLKISDPDFSIDARAYESMGNTVDVRAGQSIALNSRLINLAESSASGFQFKAVLAPGLSYKKNSAYVRVYDGDGILLTEQSAVVSESADSRTIYVNLNEELQANARATLDYTALVDADQCRGAWLPVGSFGRKGDLTIEAETTVNVIPTC